MSDRLADEYAARLGALHSAVKKVLREQDKRLAGEPGEQVSSAIEQLRAEYEAQQGKLDADERQN